MTWKCPICQHLGTEGHAPNCTRPDYPFDDLGGQTRPVVEGYPSFDSTAGSQTAPIDMVLHCPVCHMQHIDAPDPMAGWSNPPHRSHKCHMCGTVWRPADVATNGVIAIKTRGANDTYPKPR